MYIAQVYMLFTVYIYINIKHRYLYVCTIYVLGGLRGNHTFLGVTGPTHLLGGEERRGETWGGADRKGLEGAYRKIKAFQAQREVLSGM